MILVFSDVVKVRKELETAPFLFRPFLVEIYFFESFLKIFQKPLDSVIYYSYICTTNNNDLIFTDYKQMSTAMTPTLGPVPDIDPTSQEYVHYAKLPSEKANQELLSDMKASRTIKDPVQSFLKAEDAVDSTLDIKGDSCVVRGAIVGKEKIRYYWLTSLRDAQQLMLYGFHALTVTEYQKELQKRSS